MIITDLYVLYIRIGENDIETERTVRLELKVLMDIISYLCIFRQLVEDSIVEILCIFHIIIFIINIIALF